MSQIPVYLVLSLPLVGAYAMFAIGIAVIYRASRVLNLAHGAMAMVPAFVAYGLATAGLPMVVWLPAGIAAGAVLGVLIEWVFVRTLRRQSATAQTVGTVAALGLILSAAIKIGGTTPRTAPSVFAQGGVHVGASTLRWGELGLFGVAVVVAAGLFWFFVASNTGRAMQAAADNRRGAALVGINPDATTRTAWAIGGALAALAGILLASVTVLEPVGLTQLVLPAFVACLIGGLSSVPGALAGAAVVGLVQGMVPAIRLIPGVGQFATQVGATQAVLTVLALVVMVLRGARFSVAASASERDVALSSRRTRDAEPSAAASASAPRGVRTGLIAVAAALLLAFPFLGVPFSIVGDAVQACILCVVAASLVLLTGWVGQISLAQASFVGVGAFATAALANRAGIDFPLSLPIVAVISAGVAAALGTVALRVRGLYLAVATLIFVWMSDEYLFRTSWFVGGSGSISVETPPVGSPGARPFFDFSERKTFYFVALAAAAATLWALANLRDSKTGRAFQAVRGSEVAAASLGIDVTRTKLLAFSVSGLLAGIAGSLIAVGQGSAAASQFTFKASLFYLAVAVVGGLRSLGGAVAASVVFAGLEELFFRVSFLSGWLEVVGAGLLAGVLLAYPGGVGGAFARLGRALGLSGGALRASKAAGDSMSDEALVTTSAPSLTGTPPLRVSGVTVRFGGLTAVDGFSLEVKPGQIVGLIGPNGAGKTTLFNAISGITTPTAGNVEMFGSDVTDWPVHKRARLGVGRTFQVIQLFEGMSVLDNLLVATHAADKTGPASHLLVTRPAVNAETQSVLKAKGIVQMLGLGHIEHLPVTGLPFGVLRMVELARALVSDAKLIMLDEPASGLDNNETERLAKTLHDVRDRFGCSILLIEHDVRMVTSVSDYVYVIERGAPLAHGTPDEISRNPAVIAAYLGEGGDEEFGGDEPPRAMMAATAG